MGRDYYQILGVPRHAGADEIERAFRRLARQHHPDTAGAAGASTFRQVAQAYETLTDERRRRHYDAGLAARRPMRAPEPGRPERGRAASRSAEYFADEVAIDFPSVGEAIERIRQDFFGADDRARPLRADVELSAAEAFHGATVPLDVPVRRTCAMCGGRGEVWLDYCTACGGSGESIIRHRVDFTVPAGVPDGTRLLFVVSTPCTAQTRIEVRISVLGS